MMINEINIENQPAGFNDTEYSVSWRPYSRLILDAADKYRDRTAVYTDNGSMTYGEFFSRAAYACGAVAERCGAASQKRAAVLLGKGIDLFTAAMGIVLSGNVYVPLDYDYPEEAVRVCLENANADIIIADEKWRSILSDGYAEKLVSPEELSGASEDMSVFRDSFPEELFCIIHTSGTTSFPKGALLTHGGIVNTLRFSAERFELSENDTAIALTNHCHDMSLFDIFGLFIAGASVVILSEENWLDPDNWIRLIGEHSVSVWNSVPSVASVMTERAGGVPASIRKVILGGEAIPMNIARQVIAAPGCRLISVGGPTETSIWSIYHIARAEDTDRGVIPYGKPIWNMKYRLLDDELRDVPAGEQGVMYVSGPGVSLGYTVESENKRFCKDSTRQVWYNTGDVGVFDENAGIIFCGRNDNQVKLFGKRIELDGIEARILQLDGIRSAKAMLDRDKQTIVLFYTSESELSEGRLREWLSKNIPDYMLPKRFIHLKEMPLTHNGKTDKNVLAGMLDGNGCSAPDKTAETVTAVWRKVLKLEGDIPDDVNFFAAGGNSLDAIKASAQINKALGCHTTLSSVFENPVLSGFIESVRNSIGEKTAELSADSNGEYYLTQLQQMMYLPLLMGKYVDKLILTNYIDIIGDIDTERFRNAVYAAYLRQPVLRFEFSVDSDGQPFERRGGRTYSIDDIFEVITTDSFDTCLEEEAKWQPDQSSGRLCRFVLMTDSADIRRHRLCIIIHHLVSDEATFGIIVNDIMRFYDSPEMIGKSEEAKGYGSYLSLKHTDPAAEDMAYWERTFSDRSIFSPERISSVEEHSDEGVTVTCDIDREAEGYFLERCRENGSTEFISLLTAFCVSLCCLRGECSTAVMMPISDRTEQYNDVAGNFIDELLLYISFSEHDTFAEMLDRVQECFRLSIAAGTRSMYKYMHDSGLAGVFYQNRLDIPYFNYIDVDSREISSKSFDLSAMKFYGSGDTAETSFILHVDHTSGSNEFIIGHKYYYLDSENAERFIGLFREVIARAARDDKVRLSELMSGTVSAKVMNDTEPVEEHSGSSSSADADESLTAKVREVWTEVLGSEPESDDINFFDAGGYSFLLYELSAALNKKMNMKIPFMALMEYTTVASMAEYLEDLDEDE